MYVWNYQKTILSKFCPTESMVLPQEVAVQEGGKARNLHLLSDLPVQSDFVSMFS